MRLVHILKGKLASVTSFIPQRPNRPKSPQPNKLNVSVQMKIVGDISLEEARGVLGGGREGGGGCRFPLFIKQYLIRVRTLQIISPFLWPFLIPSPPPPSSSTLTF